MSSLGPLRAENSWHTLLPVLYDQKLETYLAGMSPVSSSGRCSVAGPSEDPGYRICCKHQRSLQQWVLSAAAHCVSLQSMRLANLMFHSQKPNYTKTLFFIVMEIFRIPFSFLNFRERCSVCQWSNQIPLSQTENQEMIWISQIKIGLFHPFDHLDLTHPETLEVLIKELKCATKEH